MNENPLYRKRFRESDLEIIFDHKKAFSYKLCYELMAQSSQLVYSVRNDFAGFETAAFID